jgi:hypothetical protein
MVSGSVIPTRAFPPPSSGNRTRAVALPLGRARKTARAYDGKSNDGELTGARKEVQVGVIVIRCPNTGREISTGMEADPRTYQKVPVFFGRTYCQSCRTHHDWFAKDARVRDDMDCGIGRRPSGAWLRRD